MKNNKVKIKLNKKIWNLATVLEWLIVPIYIAAMGYEINIPVYISLKKWQYVSYLYYIISVVDIALFGYFVIVYKKNKQLRLMGIAVFCCLTQIILLISKVKF